MTSVITLLEKLYGPNLKAGLSHLNYVLNRLSNNLKVQTKFLGTERGWVRIGLSGEDEGAALAYLRRMFGVAPESIGGLPRLSVIRGRIVEPGGVGYGLYVDVGVFTPEKVDALIPLHALRRQLADGIKHSVRQIVSSYCFHENFPLEVRMLSASEGKLEAELTDRQVDVYRSWARSNLGRLVAIGATQRQVETALARTGHKRDITKIDAVGLLECVIVCKLGTDPAGLIKEIGPAFPGVSLHPLNPLAVKAFL